MLLPDQNKLMVFTLQHICYDVKYSLTRKIPTAWTISEQWSIEPPDTLSVKHMLISILNQRSGMDMVDYKAEKKKKSMSR